MSSSPKKSPCSKHASEQLSKLNVPAVVVPRDLVEPGGPLQIPRSGEHERLPRLVAARKAREAPAAGIALRRVRLPLAVAVGHLVGAAEARAAGRVDDVGGVIDDDVEIHLHPQAVRTVDENREAWRRPEMRVDLREVDAPVPVVGGAVSLDVLLRDDRRDPDRREPEILQPGEPRPGVLTGAGQALQVAAVVPAEDRPGRSP